MSKRQSTFWKFLGVLLFFLSAALLIAAAIDAKSFLGFLGVAGISAVCFIMGIISAGMSLYYPKAAKPLPSDE